MFLNLTHDLGVFKSMLLLKKKKYAAISLHLNRDGTYREEKELKGNSKISPHREALMNFF